jgi:hypothetical protein
MRTLSKLAAAPSPCPSPRWGEGTLRRHSFSSPLGEREGPSAKRCEGEGEAAMDLDLTHEQTLIVAQVRRFVRE